MAFDSNPYYYEVDIDHTVIDADLSDFILYIGSMPSAFFSRVHSTGKDIRVSNEAGTVEFPIHLRYIDTGTDTIRLFTKVSAVSTTADTRVRVWCGDHTLSLYADGDTYGRNAVYSAKLKIAFGMTESLAGATGVVTYMDMTGNGYNGYDYVDATAKDGKLGSGESQEFGGSNDYIDFSTEWVASLPCTVICWFRRDATGVSHTIYVSDRWSLFGAAYAGICIQVIGTDLIRIGYGDGTGRATAYRRSKDAYTTSANTWYHLGAIIRGQTDMSIIVDGVDAGGSYSGGGGATPGNTTSKGTIGAYESGAGEFFDGDIDELWVVEGDLGTAYIKALYINQNNPAEFYTVGTEKTNGSFLPQVVFIS